MDQSEQNLTTRLQWQMYSSHRQRIERLIVPPRPDSKICVLGAGNCNDLDLRWLTEVYREVHLVDLDPSAVNDAVVRQSAASPKLHIHAPFDLTNASAELAKVNLARWIDRINEPPVTPWGPCDVVLSPCVLTQTIIPFRDAAKDQPPEMMKPLRTALIRQHLRLITASLTETGTAALILDLISSEKIEDLPRIPPSEVAPAMDRFIRAEKHFRGIDPRSMIRACEGLDVEDVQASEPWLWHLGLRKSFIVYALTYRRRRRKTSSF